MPIARFACQCQVQAGATRPAARAEPLKVPERSAEETILRLLAELRGRPVILTLQDGAEVAGRVVSAEPVTLVSDDGRITVVTGLIVSVAF